VEVEGSSWTSGCSYSLPVHATPTNLCCDPTKRETICMLSANNSPLCGHRTSCLSTLVAQLLFMPLRTARPLCSMRLVPEWKAVQLRCFALSALRNHRRSVSLCLGMFLGGSRFKHPTSNFPASNSSTQGHIATRISTTRSICGLRTNINMTTIKKNITTNDTTGRVDPGDKSCVHNLRL